MDEFDQVLLKAIDDTLRYSLGEKTIKIFYEYLKRKGFPLSSIPQDPEFFFNELRNVLEFEGSRFHNVSSLGTVSILERAIIEVLCKKFGVEFNEKGPIVFSEWVEKVREAYSLRRVSRVKILEKRR
ncbi:MAG: hypothetical protein QHH12_04745 [Candidatus Bathyarchaeota archaeon]|nr:hypothetical protein [Candidatus Bathyarchaeota archaeon]